MANVTGTHASAAAAQPALTKDAARRVESSKSAAASSHKPAGYGLPCLKCHLYYPADLDRCPTCNTTERVSPVVPKIPPKPVQGAPAPLPDSAAVEKEREEFLRQFKAQLLEAHAEMGDALEAVCKLGEHHPGDSAPAEICNACYDRLQERVDVLEASLHIDVKEAAQIVYDAVWADPSDPSKTYQNAASALLNELRKRGGITTILGPFQPLKH